MAMLMVIIAVIGEKDEVFFNSALRVTLAHTHIL